MKNHKPVQGLRTLIAASVISFVAASVTARPAFADSDAEADSDTGNSTFLQTMQAVTEGLKQANDPSNPYNQLNRVLRTMQENNQSAAADRMRQQDAINQRLQYQQTVAAQQRLASTYARVEQDSPQQTSRTTENSEESVASQCLRIVVKDNRNAIANGCSRTVHYAFCGTDAGIGESVGVCGRDIGGSLLAPGEVQELTQGAEGSRVKYFAVGCYSPSVPRYLSFTGNHLMGRCEH